MISIANLWADAKAVLSGIDDDCTHDEEIAELKRQLAAERRTVQDLEAKLRATTGNADRPTFNAASVPIKVARRRISRAARRRG